MNASRVVVFCGDSLSPLYLHGAKWVDGKVVSGDVENGAWHFLVDGNEIQAKDGRFIVNRWHYNVKHTVEIPPDVRGNYNEVIEWAQEQLK